MQATQILTHGETTMLCAHFDRFDIAEAHAVLEADFNVGGWLRERLSNQRRAEASAVQLRRIGFRHSPLGGSFRHLSRNGRAIYLNARRALGLRGGK
jgi:hypothetical protein